MKKYKLYLIAVYAAIFSLPFAEGGGGACYAQQLAKGEYYIDTDPGAGAGTAFTFTQADSINLPLSIPVNSLAVGFHKVYFRIKDTNGKWGHSGDQLFYVYDNTAPPAAPVAAQLAKGEYYIDTDPGAGHGTAFTFTQADSVNLPLSLPVNAASVGFHKLYTRFKDSNNKWGHSAEQLFYVYDATPPPAAPIAAQLKKGEYYIDTDPGVSHGTAFTFTQADSINLPLTVPLNSLAVGFHKLYFRIEDSNNKWGLSNEQLFYVYGNTPPVYSQAAPVAAMEYFFDANDYGPGQCAPYTAFTAADSINANGSITASDPVFMQGLSAGHHTINIRAKDAAGKWGLTKSIGFTVCDQFHPAHSSFTSSVSGTVATFTNTSSDDFGTQWSFGDASFSSDTSTTVVHTYNNGGTVNVRLISSNACGSDTVSHMIILNCVTPVSNFNFISNDLTSVFTSSSQGATSYSWSFGDSKFSADANPTHVFQNTGTYNVCDTVRNGCGTNTLCKPVSVTCVAPASAYSVNINGLTATFNNLSTNAFNFIWNFGDGQTDNINFTNVHHQYASPGTYLVKLTVANGCGNNIYQTNITIICIAPLADFDTITSGLHLEVNNTSLNGTLWHWNFGDNSSSTFKNPPIHLYSAVGTYIVCLKATNSCGSDSICRTVSVCTPPVVSFTSSVNGHTADFANTSTNVSYYVWNFGDGIISNIPAPSHTYSAAQNYSVCLTAYNGCGNNQLCKNVNAKCAPNNPPAICMVTVDSLSKFNIIFWDKTSYTTAIDSFFIYRDLANNNYALIGKVPYDSLSEFIDTVRTLYAANGDPNATSWRYKIALKDTCGGLSPMSLYHQTLFIQHDNLGHFTWNNYMIEGVTPPIPALSNYLFQQDPYTAGIWSTIQTASASSTSYTYVNYSSYPNADYRVITQWSISCSPTRAQNRSVSNHKPPPGITTGIIQQAGINEHLITIAPNPAQNTLEAGYPEGISTIEIYNGLGQLMIKQNANGNLKQIFDVSWFNSGIYQIKFIGERGSVNKKFVKIE